MRESVKKYLLDEKVFKKFQLVLFCFDTIYNKEIINIVVYICKNVPCFLYPCGIREKK